MGTSSDSIIKTGSGGDLAFSVIVGASYLTMFGSGLPLFTPFRIVTLIIIGVAYLAFGIYIYAYVARTGDLLQIYAYFIIQIPLSASIIYISKGAGFNALLMLPLAGHAVILLKRRQVFFVCFAICLAYVVAVRLYSGDIESLWNSLITFLAGLIFVVVFTQISVNEEQSRSEVERLAIELERANRDLREYAARVKDLTISQERNRFAREIHDGLGHYLTAIHVQIQAAEAVLESNPKEVLHLLTKAQTLCKDALVDVRRSVAALRAPSSEDKPLNERLESLLDECLTAGIKAAFSVIGIPRPLKPQIDLALYRTAQEGMNNIFKHAKATEVTLTLEYCDRNLVRLKIQDNGAGSTEPQGGFGLLGLKERAHLLDGEVYIHTNPQEGFSLIVEIPA